MLLVLQENHTCPPHNPFHTGCWKQLTLQKAQLDKLTMDSKTKNACGHPLCKMCFSGYQASQVCWDNRDGTCVKHSSSFPGFHTCCIGCSVNTSIISCAGVMTKMGHIHLSRLVWITKSLHENEAINIPVLSG